MWFFPLLDITVRISNLPSIAVAIGELVKLIVIPQCQAPIMNLIEVIAKNFSEVVVTII